MPREARTAFAQKHAESQRINYAVFTRLMCEDTGLAFLDNLGTDRVLCRLLFTAVHNQLGIHTTGDGDTLLEKTAAAKKALQGALVKAHICGDEAAAAVVVMEVYGHARAAVTSPPNAGVDCVRGNSSKSTMLRQSLVGKPHRDKGWLTSALREGIYAEDNAAEHYHNKTIAVQQSIATEDYIGDLMQALTQACKMEPFDADTAVATAAVMLREAYERAPEMAHQEDIAALYALRFPHDANQPLPKIDVMNHGILSEASAVVLLACQKQIAREMTIEMARSNHKVNHADAVQAYKPIADMFGRHMKALNMFINKLVKEHYLLPHEHDVLLQNASRIQAAMYTYAKEQTGRGAGRSV